MKIAKIILMVILSIGLTGCFVKEREKVKDKTLLYESKNLQIKEINSIPNETTNKLELRYYSQVSDEQAIGTLGKVFVLKNDTNKDVKYNLILKESSKNTISTSKIKYILNKTIDDKEIGNPKTTFLNEIKGNVLSAGTIKSKSNITFGIRIWIDQKQAINSTDTADFEVIVNEVK
jgi:hypothetical protein